jgi:hypothetical protein
MLTCEWLGCLGLDETITTLRLKQSYSDDTCNIRCGAWRWFVSERYTVGTMGWIRVRSSEI